jgi:hypothetical protein
MALAVHSHSMEVLTPITLAAACLVGGKPS